MVRRWLSAAAGGVLRRLTMVELEHAAESLSAHDFAGAADVPRQRIDELTLESLMMALPVVMGNQLVLLTEKSITWRGDIPGHSALSAVRPSGRRGERDVVSIGCGSF